MLVLRLGSSGDEVRALQNLLLAAGCDPMGEDGLFGLSTEAAVRRFQGIHDLTIDGVVAWPDGQTSGALHLMADHPQPVPVSAPVDASFAGCLAFTLQEEGGFSDDPQDPGGATNRGITLKTLEAYQHGATVEQLKAISPDLVSAIYRREYWTVTGSGDLPDGVALIVFDFAVNAGPGRSVGMLQVVAGVERDGSDGPATQAAIAKTSAADVVTRLTALQRAYYEALPTFPRFGKGWLARTDRRAALAQKMVAAAVAGTPANPV